MEDRITRIQRQAFNVIQEELRELMNDVIRGALDPSQIMAFARAIGIDMSQLPGMVRNHAGFDPYQMMGLDKSASNEAVKKRYKELLYKLHPDTAGVEGTAFLLQMVLAAYEMIKQERGWK